MKLLHVICSVNPETGGPVEVILSAASVLEAQGCKQEIISLDSPLDSWTRTVALPHHAMGIRNSRYLARRKKIPWLRYGYMPHFVPWLKENANRFDMIIVHGLWNYAALGSWRALAKGNTPYCVYAHGMLDPYFNQADQLKTIAKQILWWFSEGRLIANATSVLFAAEEERRLARVSFWPYRCKERVVAFGTRDAPGNGKMQAASFRSAFPQLNGKRFILFLSRIHPKKGCDLLIRAFFKAASHRLDLGLVIAGPDPAGCGKELRALAKELGIDGRIHWTGMLKGDLQWGAFRAAEAFVLPSHQENFGMAIAEAMVCGRPILTTNKVNIWRELQESGAGFIANDDLEGVTSLLEQFLKLSAEEKHIMGERARQCFERKFNIGVMGRELMEAFSGGKGA